jgi:hypothetical protein
MPCVFQAHLVKQGTKVERIAMTQCIKGRAVMFSRLLKVQSGSLGKGLALGRARKPINNTNPTNIICPPVAHARQRKARLADHSAVFGQGQETRAPTG